MAKDTELKDLVNELKAAIENNAKFIDVAKETVLHHFTGTGAHIPLYPIEIEFRNFVKHLQNHNSDYLNLCDKVLKKLN